MRLIGVIAAAAVSAPLLMSCNSEDSEEPWMAYNQKCEQLGFKRGTREHDKRRLETGAPRDATRERAGRPRLSHRYPYTAAPRNSVMSCFSP
jgi:hypothetical protein